MASSLLKLTIFYSWCSAVVFAQCPPNKISQFNILCVHSLTRTFTPVVKCKMDDKHFFSYNGLDVK